MTKTISHRRVPTHRNGATHASSVGGLKSLITQAKSTISDAGSHASEDIQALRDRLSSGITTVRAGAKKIAKAARKQTSRADDAIHEKPYHAMGIAAGLGLIVGFLIARRRAAR